MNGPAIPLRRRARFVARHLGLDIHRYQAALDVGARRTRFLREHRVGALIDGGANTGQWALGIRGNGYRGLIISFEPLGDPFAALRVTSAGDPLWRCVQAALGDADTEAGMNVAGNSVSSSLLPMELTHLSAAPESAYVRTEAVAVVRLDSVVPKMVPAGTSLALKLDLQGYEAAALAGAEGILAEVCLVECELSIVSLYHGQPLYLDMIDLLDGLGFSLASLSEGLTDPATGHVMQMDAIFFRADGPRPTPR
jgi:FkbM family methyltransferase